jgi:hypothetical protein
MADDPTDAPPPPPKLDYRRSNDSSPYCAPMPAPAGFVIGVAVFVSTVGVAVLLVRLGRFDLGGVCCLLAGAPLVSFAVAGFLQAHFHWPAVVAGALTSIGLTALIGCLLCGGIR